MYEIDIADCQEHLAIDEDFVTEVVRRTLEAEQVSSASISIAIVDNGRIHEINRQYLNHDYETDVISFLLETSAGSGCDGSSSNGPRGRGLQIDGEVIVSTEMAIDMAADYDWSPLDEFTLYIVHGLLHLCGYDDLTEDELPIMRARECDILELLGRPRPTRDASDRGHIDESRSAQVQTVPQTGGQS